MTKKELFADAITALKNLEKAFNDINGVNIPEECNEEMVVYDSLAFARRIWLW